MAVAHHRGRVRHRGASADRAARTKGDTTSSASPLANASDDGLHYINADYTLVMAREPVGEWVGLEAAEHLAAGGVAVGTCTLYDLEGPFGTSVTTALANPPLQMES